MSVSRWLCGLASILVATVSVFGYQEPENPPLPDFDKRRELLADAAPNAGREAAAKRLRERVRGVRVDFDRITGGPKWIASHDRFLTDQVAIPADDPHRAVKAFVAEHADLFGHGPEVLEKARVKRSFIGRANGLRTVVWEQELEGLRIFEALFIGHTSERGEVVSISSQLLKSPELAAGKGNPNWRAAKTAPKVSARRAVIEAGRNLNVPMNEADLEEQVEPLAKAFRGPRLKGPARAQMAWLPMDEDTLRLTWEIHIAVQPGGELYRLFVDSETGEVLARHCRTFYLEDVTYRVFTTASPAPMSPGPTAPTTNQAPVVNRGLVTLSALSTNASPTGWIADGENQTRGNNVDAHLDRDADDQPDLPRPHASPGRLFDFPLDLTQPPISYGDAATVQLFYWCNWMHDRLYELGFTEPAGNFQKDNFGRGGLDNDPMLADAQDGSGVNNARYFQWPEGYPGRIEMFLFDGPAPDRDGSLDAEIVLHEYAHGLTDRVVGGGAGIYQWVTYGLAEGWSDFYALATLTDPAADLEGTYTEGGYSTYQLIGLDQNYYFGIRRYPYSTDMSKNPLTFKDIDRAQIGAYPDVPRSPIHVFNPARADEPHRVGEIWCLTLWEARANLIRKHGPSVGNELVLQLVTDALKLSPPNPTFLQARDAILLADRALTGGANQLELWAAFAKRGMGLQAAEGPNYVTDGARESFDRPDTLLVTPFTTLSFSGPAGGPFGPNCRSLVLSNSSAQSLTWSAGGADPYLAFSASSATLAPGASMTISICPTPAIGSLQLGNYGLSLWFSNHLSGVVLWRDVQLKVMEFAAMPFREGFEGASLAPFWQITGTALGRATLTTNLSPQTGAQHLILQSGANGLLARNEVTLGVDLAGYTNVVLNFWAKEFGDEPHGPPPVPFQDSADFDGVAISMDGFLWYETVGLRRLRDDYSEITVNLDETIRRHGLEYTSAFRIRFNQADNGVIPNDGIALDSIRLDGVAPRRFRISLPENLTESHGTVRGQAEVRLGAIASAPVLVELTSSDPSVARVPTAVVLPAGAASVAFDLSIQDDELLEGAQTAVIRASASGYLAGEARLMVADDESAVLSLELPPSLPEGSGTASGLAWVRLDQNTIGELVIELKSSDRSLVDVPAAVVVPSGTNAAPFDLIVADDGAIDGPQTATITARLDNLSTASAALTIQDNESTNLFLTLPALVGESSTVLGSGSMVRLSGTLPTNLIVTLVSSAPGLLRTPPTVTILAGRVSAPFSLTVFEDMVRGDAAPVTIEAHAGRFASATNSVRVLDNDAAPTPFGPSPEPFSVNPQQNVSLSWSLGTPELVSNGDFENGTAGGWRSSSSEPMDIVVNDGAVNPPGPESLTTPFAGQFSLLIQPSTPGYRIIHQDVTIPLHFDSAALNWTDRIRNHADVFSDEHYFRVEISTPDNIPLGVLFSTEPGYPALNEWQERTFDLSAYRGAMLRITFIQRDSLGFMNVHLDNIRVMLSSAGPASSEVYFGGTPDLGPQHLLGLTSGTSYNLPPLGFDADYYWRIIARRGDARAVGPVWRFRTGGVGSLEYFTWSGLGGTQTFNQPFPAIVTAKDKAGNTVSSFAKSVQLRAEQREAAEPVRVLTFSGYAGREYRGTLAGISSHFTNYIETTILAPEALEANLVGQDVFLVPEQAAAPAGTLETIAMTWGRVLSNFVYQGGTVIVCSYLRNEHQILNSSGLMQLTRIAPFATGVLRVAANHALVEGIPSTFEAPNVAAYTSLNGFPVVDITQTNAAVVLTRTVGSGQVVMIGYDFSENRTPFDRIGANAVRLAERERILPIPVSPAVSGYFEAGVWPGNLSVSGVGSNIVLIADDVEGHSGVSPPLTVVAPHDLSVAITDEVDPIFVGSNVVYRVLVRHTAPGTAHGVAVSLPLPAGVTVVSATPSIGACVVNGPTIQCGLGEMTGDTEATIVVQLTANTGGRLELAAELTSSSPDTYPDNNAATESTRVLLPSVYVADVVTTEVNSGTSPLTFSVELRPAIRQSVTVSYATSNSTALAGIDYGAGAGVLVFPPGTTNRTIELSTFGDTLFEGAELFQMQLFAISNAIPGKVTASAVILENDAPPVLSVADATAYEGRLGAVTQAVFNVTLSTNAGVAVTVDYAAASGTALPALDFRPTSGTVSLPAGVASTNFVVPVLGDFASELTETFGVKLSAVANATLARTQASGFIIDDDGGQIEGFAWDPIPSPQSYDVPFVVRVTAQDSLGNTATNYGGPAKLAGWTASRQITTPQGTNSWEFPMGAYFHDQRLQAIYLPSEIGEASRITALALQVTTLPGQPLERWTIRMKHTGQNSFSDAVWEQDWHTVFQNTEIVTSNGWALFQFNEPFEYNGVEHLLVDFSFNNATFSSDGKCLATPTSDLRSLYFRTDSGFGDPLDWAGAEPPGALARQVPTALFIVERSVAMTPEVSGTFNNGVWQGTVAVQEVVENMSIRAEDGRNHFGSANLFSVTATHDIAVTASDVPDPVRVGELLTYRYVVTNTGPSLASSVSLTNLLPASVVLKDVTSSQGSCLVEGPLVRCSLGVLGAAAVASVNVTVEPRQAGFITNGVRIARDEIDVFLGNNIAQTVTRVNPLAVLTADASVTELTGALTNLVFSIRLSSTNADPVQVEYFTSNGSASNNVDYLGRSGVLTFAPGVTNLTVTVPVVGDVSDEPNETCFLNLTNAVNAAIVQSRMTGTIIDDDLPPVLTVLDVAGNEGNAGTVVFPFAVQLSAPSEYLISVSLATSNGTATASQDYSAANLTFLMPPRLTNRFFNVNVLGERLIEADEMFFVNVSRPQNVTLGSTRAVGTIVNDDGLPGVLEYFQWSPPPDPAYVESAFPATLTARDSFGTLLTNYAGTVGLRGRVGQPDVSIGTPNSQTQYPLAAGHQDARMQVIYLAPELQGARPIMGVALEVLLPPAQTLNQFTVRLKHTTNSNYTFFPMWETNDWMIVYRTNLTITSPGWLTFPFFRAFPYDGTNHLMVDFSFDNSFFSVDGAVRFHATNQNRTIAGFSDSTAGDPLTWNVYTPITQVIVGTPVVKFICGRDVPTSPTTAEPFANGMWNGNITVVQAATNLALIADDGLGHVGLSTLFDVIESADSDSDGLLDAWELEYFGNLAAQPDADADGDGLLNIEEQAAGTHPGDAANVLEITRIDAGPAGIRIGFQSVAGKRYRLERSPRVSGGPWTVAADNLSGVDGTLEVLDSAPVGVTSFYRIRLLP